MTLIVAAVGRDFVLITTDTQSFADTAEGAWERSDVRVGGKCKQVSDRVLFAAGGDYFVSSDFIARLRERVVRDDDLAACREHAQSLLNEMCEEDEPAFVNHAGRMWRRKSIRDPKALGFYLVGFTAAGAAGIATRTMDANAISEISEYEGTLRLAFTFPYGVDDDGSLNHWFKSFRTQEDIDLATFTPIGAFARAYEVHLYVAENFDARVSTDLECHVLEANGKLRFSQLDIRDPEATAAVFRSLLPDEASP